MQPAASVSRACFWASTATMSLLEVRRRAAASFRLRNIAEAKLVLTDKLIEEDLKARKTRNRLEAAHYAQRREHGRRLPPTGPNFCRSPMRSRATSRSTKPVVLHAMEEAMQRAAKAHYGSENEIQCRDRSQDGRDPCLALSERRRASRQRQDRDQPGRCARAQSRRAGRRHHRRDAAAGRFQPHQRAERQAGDRAESARRRARAPIRGIQGPHRRNHPRHRQARGIRFRRRRSGPCRRRRAPRRDDPARKLPHRRSHPRLYLRRAPRNPRAADFPVAQPSAIHGAPVRAGSARNL